MDPHTHPYQAGLFIAFGGGTGLCGASVISNRAVLTAAHCSVGSSSTQIVFGAHQITIVEGAQVRHTVPSGNYRIHAGYNSGNLNNDIAILITTAWIGYTAAIQPINMADGGAPSFEGVWSLTSGWGGIESGGTSSHLRIVDNVIISNGACAAVYGGIIIGSTICTATTGGRGTCGGDSGGPLTVGHPGPRTLVGVTSFVSGAGCMAGHPAGFARVSSFRGWINANMNP